MEERAVINKIVSPMEGFRSDSVSVMPFPPMFQVPPPAPSSSHDHDHDHDHDQLAAAVAAGTENASRKRTRQMGPTLERTESLQMERDRRLKMSQMFAELQSTVPGLFSKATREVIVNETINYIKDLENKKKRLEELKGSTMIEPSVVASQDKLILARTTSNRNSSITVTVSAANVAFFGIQSKAQPGLLTLIFKVFFKHNAEILAANVSVNNGELTLAITALLPHNGADGDGNATAEKIKTEILSL